MMKVIPETRRAHLIWHLRFYWLSIWFGLRWIGRWGGDYDGRPSHHTLQKGQNNTHMNIKSLDKLICSMRCYPFECLVSLYMWIPAWSHTNVSLRDSTFLSSSLFSLLVLLPDLTTWSYSFVSLIDQFVLTLKYVNICNVSSDGTFYCIELNNLKFDFYDITMRNIYKADTNHVSITYNW